MSDWQERAEIDEDVVFFQYADSEKEKQANDVYVWDLDKTYLDTKFETFKGLVRTIFEKAFQKKNIPGDPCAPCWGREDAHPREAHSRRP